MAAFLASMTFPRWVIFACVLTALPLGWMGYTQSNEVNQLEQDNRDVAKVVRRNQELAMQLDGLQQLGSSEKLKGQEGLDFYVRGVSQDPKVSVGQVNTSPSTKNLANQVVDKKLTVKPADPKRAYSRSQLVNFLYKLETDSRRVKVTDMEIEPVERRVRPQDVVPDQWTFDVTITSRQKVE